MWICRIYCQEASGEEELSAHHQEPCGAWEVPVKEEAECNEVSNELIDAKNGSAWEKVHFWKEKLGSGRVRYHYLFI